MRGMLKQIVTVASLVDDGVMDVGVHTIAIEHRKSSNIHFPVECYYVVNLVKTSVFHALQMRSCQGVPHEDVGCDFCAPAAVSHSQCNAQAH